MTAAAWVLPKLHEQRIADAGVGTGVWAIMKSIPPNPTRPLNDRRYQIEYAT